MTIKWSKDSRMTTATRAIIRQTVYHCPYCQGWVHRMGNEEWFCFSCRKQWVRPKFVEKRERDWELANVRTS